MSDALASLAHPHEQFYAAVYNELDPSNTGNISSAATVQLLRTSNLPMPLLGQIWEQADSQKRGCLDRQGFFVALKLVAAAQQGQPVAASSLSLPLARPLLVCVASNLPSGAPSPMQSAPAWGISPSDQQKYDSIFDSLIPEGGLLPGAKVRPVLLNSGLNAASLAKIWELADVDGDGSLDRIEMALALHLVYKALQGEAIPDALPPSLLHPSKPIRRQSVQSAGVLRSRTGSLGSLNELPLSGTPPGPPRAYSVAAARSSAFASPAPVSDWPIRLADFAEQFAALDTDADGLVSGADCRNLLLSSGHPQGVLARVWSLADTSRSGMLNLEQFSLALYLLGLVAAGQELPASLPAHLLPPSLRSIPAAPPSLPSDSISALTPEDENDPETASILQEIASMDEERLKTEQEMAQLEADLNVKKSHIKHIQIELKTLDGTVKQLEKQKGEASRRLAEMDSQVTRFRGLTEANRTKAAETQRRLATQQEEASESEGRREEETAEMQSFSLQLSRLTSTANEREASLREGLASLESTVAQLSALEREAVSADRQLQQARTVTSSLELLREELTAACSREGPSHSSVALVQDLQRFSLDDSISRNAASPSQAAAFAVNGGGTSAPPPRPAPPGQKKIAPINEDPFANTDPFSSADAATSRNGFADFANFGAFS